VNHPNNDHFVAASHAIEHNSYYATLSVFLPRAELCNVVPSIHTTEPKVEQRKVEQDQ
jgi:hypothetical protein